MAAPIAAPAALQHEAPSPALAAALAHDNHAALREADTPTMLRVVIAAYGGAGSPALLAALAAGGHAALRAACARDDWHVGLNDASDSELLHAWYEGESVRRAKVGALLAAYGGHGSAALSDALAAVGAGCLLAASRLADQCVLNDLVEAFGGAGSDAAVAALCAGGGRHAHHAAALSVGDGLSDALMGRSDPNIQGAIEDAKMNARMMLVCSYGERGIGALIRAARGDGAILALFHEFDYQLRYETFSCPEAWQPRSGGRRPLARDLLSPVERADMALPVLCAVSALPIAAPMLAFLPPTIPCFCYACISAAADTAASEAHAREQREGEASGRAAAVSAASGAGAAGLMASSGVFILL
jgi:hypothetical protein